MVRQTRTKKAATKSTCNGNKAKGYSESLLAKCERMQLKRFPEGLTPGAKRSRSVFPHDVKVDYPKSSGALCRGCDSKIAKGLPRVALFLQCHLGYKDKSLTHYVHLDCLTKHPEAHKIESIDEIAGLCTFTEEDKGKLEVILKALGKIKVEK